eukprot:7166812-Prymnesium_polylepis.1
MSAGLPSEGKMAEKSALKSLEEDGRKAALASGEENLKASAASAMGGRAQASVMQAVKGAGQLQLTVESLCQVGDALLDVGCPVGAREAFAKAKEAGENKDMRAACGEIAAMIALGSPATEVSAAYDVAKKLYNTPSKQRALMATLQGLAGLPDEAFETAQRAGTEAKPGDGKLDEMTVLQCECEYAMYTEAAWPARAVARPERKTDKTLPENTLLSSWRLNKAEEKAKFYLKKAPKCVRAAILAAETKLESRLFAEYLAPRKEKASGGGGGGGGAGAMSATDAATLDEIKAIMRMQGIAESRMDDPAAALRAIEQKRRKVLDEGGPSAQSESDELAKLHEWQMKKLSEQRMAGATAAGAKSSSSSTSSSSKASAAPVDAVAAEALEICETTLKSVEEARHSAALSVLRGRLLLRLEKPSDAVGPLAAAATLLAPTASWRTAVANFRQTQLGSDCAETTGGADVSFGGVQLYLGLAEALHGSPFEEYGPRLEAVVEPLARALKALPAADGDGAGPQVPLELVRTPIVRCILSPLNPDVP